MLISSLVHSAGAYNDSLTFYLYICAIYNVVSLECECDALFADEQKQ